MSDHAVTEPTFSGRSKRRTGHFMRYWGPPKGIQILDALEKHPLAVLEFPPRGGRSSFRLVTNGMSEYGYPHGDGFLVRTEVYIAASRPSAELIRVLETFARYPVAKSTYFGEFDVVPISDAGLLLEPKYAGFLLAPPDPGDSADIGIIPEIWEEDILVHRVVGLLKDEFDFATEHGGEDLWARLSPLGAEVLADKPRASVL